MLCTLTAIVGIDPRFELSGPQQAVWFRHGSFAMDPFRFNRVEPRTCAWPRTHDDAHALGTLLDLLLVLTHPVPHRLAAVPGGVVPDQQHGGEALGRESGGAPRQELNRDGTHRTSSDKSAPHLVWLLRFRPQQQAITGQCLGIRSVRGGGQVRQFIRGLGLGPTMLLGLGEPTPPDCIAQPERPRRLGVGPLEPRVAPVFFRAYAGAGRVLQCLARFQDMPNRRRATRMASSLTRRGVRPWAQLTSAASWRVHRLVGWPNVRGLWCSSVRRASQVPASKRGDVVCGRDERGCSTVSPRWWKA
jgi:hypothetical protein